MEITTIKTPKITLGAQLLPLLDAYIEKLSEGDIVVVTSKIVSICEGNLMKKEQANKGDLIKKHSQWYLPPSESKYNANLSIKNNILVAAAGIDESNGNGYYILWPKNPFASAQTIWSHLTKKFSLTHLGVIIVDSVTVPLRWGTRGVAVAWCGLEPLRDYKGTPDIFGRPYEFTKLNIVDGLAAAAVLVMGEGNEQTPMAVVRDAINIVFKEKPPTESEIAACRIEPVDDVFAPLMDLSKWKKGENA